MRFSATIQKRLMYAAIPMSLPGGGRGVARLAVPIDEVAASVGRLRHIMWGALLSRWSSRWSRRRPWRRCWPARSAG